MLQSIEELKKAERALQASREQLEVRIKGLKGDLFKANRSVRQEKAEREGLERQLAESQKMEAVGRITGGIANEFSHLFSVIGKQTGLVLSRPRPDDPLYGPVDEMSRSGGQAAALTAQLATLDIHNRQFRHVLSIGTVMEDLNDVIRGLLPAQIDCPISIEPGPLDVEVDREGFEQVLLNLVVNARDAMPQQGRLTIEVTPVLSEADGEPLARVNGHPSAVRIQGRDTGSGMTRDTQSRMFEPFFSTKETNVGLGLTAVYGIVKQHGGQVDVISQPGQGDDRAHRSACCADRSAPQPVNFVSRGGQTPREGVVGRAP
ncbi:MAG TPA: ATP-binding protein [Nitrospira sp.]|nr:ATP-binding protein [Nitrospira sp.]